MVQSASSQANTYHMRLYHSIILRADTLWVGRGFFRARRAVVMVAVASIFVFGSSLFSLRQTPKPKMRRAIRFAEILLVYGAYSLLRDVAFPLSLFMALGYLYCGVSMLVAIEWTLLSILGLVFREEGDTIGMMEEVE
jgi:hypothetical protein